jgi:hypothetical protein
VEEGVLVEAAVGELHERSGAETAELRVHGDRERAAVRVEDDLGLARELFGGLLLASIGLRLGLCDLDAAPLALGLGLGGLCLGLRLGRRVRAGIAAVVGVVVATAGGDECEQHQEQRQVPLHGAEA